LVFDEQREREDIVLGFHPAEVREHTSFAVR
jgi:hypothetical protein